MPGVLRHLRIGTLASLMLVCVMLVGIPARAGGEDAAWAALSKGQAVVLIRHAQTVEGIGDPPNFRKDDCSTQRNLSEAGRESARRIGEAFRQRGIRVDEVLSSHWCRCVDTARLAFGRVRAVQMLDSMFNDDPAASDEAKLKALRDMLTTRSGSGGNLVLVTHNVNINRLTGISTASGEAVVTRARPDGSLVVIGRLQADRAVRPN